MSEIDYILGLVLFFYIGRVVQFFIQYKEKNNTNSKKDETNEITHHVSYVGGTLRIVKTADGQEECNA